MKAQEIMDPYLGEIRTFSFGYPPRGWALCNGQLLSVAQNSPLFSLLGTYYGGNGIQTFALPNLNKAFAIGAGAGPGLTPRVLGEMAGVTAVTLLTSELPAHTHAANGFSGAGDSGDPDGRLWASSRYGRATRDSFAPAANVVMAPDAVGIAGGTQAHNNMPPYLALPYMIALTGIYPSRN